MAGCGVSTSEGAAGRDAACLAADGHALTRTFDFVDTWPFEARAFLTYPESLGSDIANQTEGVLCKGHVAYLLIG